MDLTLEWLETNGLDGFASCTVCGMNTRRYHGLLTAALQTARWALRAVVETGRNARGRRRALRERSKNSSNTVTPGGI
jgi:hypothetical protein